MRATSNKRLWLVKQNERKKHAKHNNASNVLPMAMEATGAVRPEFRALLRYVAGKQSKNKSIPYPVMMHQRGSKLVAKMIRCNAKMVSRSFLL